MGTINVAWWNLENRFDTEDDPISQDFEFTAANGWTTEAYAAKRANLAAALDGLHGGLASSCLVSPRPPWQKSPPWPGNWFGWRPRNTYRLKAVGIGPMARRRA
jgi:Endonuclease/Exonuclease/phosphatase family